MTDLGIARYVEGHLELAPLEGAVDKAIAAGADVLVTSGDKKGGGFPCCGRRVGACKNMLKHLDIKGHTFDNTWEFASSHYNSAGHFKILSCGWVCLCVNAGVSMGDRDLLKPLLERKGSVQYQCTLCAYDTPPFCPPPSCPCPSPLPPCNIPPVLAPSQQTCRRPCAYAPPPPPGPSPLPPPPSSTLKLAGAVSMGDRDLLKPLCRAQGLCALC